MISESYLHYIWQFQKLPITGLYTAQKEKLQVISVGMPNTDSGPDFFNAQIILDNQKWAGNIEIHIKSSDWYLHHHENDCNYDNVILHVVWEYDMPVVGKNNKPLPTLELKNWLNKHSIENYTSFLKNYKWVPCENQFSTIDDFLFKNWMERLFFERLEDKYSRFTKLLEKSGQDWEAVFFRSILRSFGAKVNKEAFEQLAQLIPFRVIRKLSPYPMRLEALFFGLGGLLQVSDSNDSYLTELKTKYSYLRNKYKILESPPIPFKFFRLRPPNFPTIRLSQLAHLYKQRPHLFSQLMEAKGLASLHKLLTTKTSTYWETHYTFDKVSSTKMKGLSISFKNHIIINSVLPAKLAFAKYKNQNVEEEILSVINAIKIEKNSIVSKFTELRTPHEIPNSALYSQALIQLKNKYCSDHKCLQCRFGVAFLG